MVRASGDSWAVAEATSPVLCVTIASAAPGVLTVHGRAPAGQLVEATVRETGGNYLELARARAHVGAEGVYALQLRTAPPEHRGGAVVVTARGRPDYSPVAAVAVVPVTLPGTGP